MTDKPAVKIMELIKKHGFHFKKKWGQNFILDKNILSRLVNGAQIAPGDRVVEIGSGAGTLTRSLAEAGAQVLAVEIDPALIPILAESLEGLPIPVVQGDVLQMDLDMLTRRHGLAWPYKIVANLPYYITTPVIMDLLEKKYHIDSLTLMVQWEVAQRLTARPGTKEYGAITLAIRYFTEPAILFKVSRHNFNPRPEVDSAVIHLQRRGQPAVDVDNEELLFRLIKAGFGQRRKMLPNALQAVEPGLAKHVVQHRLEKAGIDGQRRGETLSLEEYAALAQVW